MTEVLRQFWDRLKDSTSRQLLIVLSGDALRLGLGLVSSAILVRALGPAGLGIFAVAGAVITIAATTADLGIASSSVKFIAEKLQAELPRGIEVARAAGQLKLVGALIVAIALLLASNVLIPILELPLPPALKFSGSPG